jgi:hypothetical protein
MQRARETPRQQVGQRRGAQSPGGGGGWRSWVAAAALAAWALAGAGAAAAAAGPPPSPGRCTAGAGLADLAARDWYYQAACAALAHGVVHPVARGDPDPPWLLPQLRLNVADWARWLVRAFPGLGVRRAQPLPCAVRPGDHALAALRAAASLMAAFPRLTPGGRCAASDFVSRAEAVTSLVDALGCQHLRLPAPPPVVLARFRDARGLPAPEARSLAIATELQPPLLVGIPLPPSHRGQPRLALDPTGVLTRAQGVTLIYRAERIRPCVAADGVRAASWHPWT